MVLSCLAAGGLLLRLTALFFLARHRHVVDCHGLRVQPEGGLATGEDSSHVGTHVRAVITRTLERTRDAAQHAASLCLRHEVLSGRELRGDEVLVVGLSLDDAQNFGDDAQPTCVSTIKLAIQAKEEDLQLIESITSNLGACDKLLELDDQLVELLLIGNGSLDDFVDLRIAATHVICRLPTVDDTVFTCQRVFCALFWFHVMLTSCCYPHEGRCVTGVPSPWRG